MRVIVVGGGIAGSFTSYFLSLRGVKVTLVSDKPKYPRVGLVLSVLLASLDDVALAARSLAIYRMLERESGVKLVHTFPVYEIFPEEADIPEILVEAWRRAGENVRRLEVYEAREETGLLIREDEWVLGGGRDYVVSIGRVIGILRSRVKVVRGRARLRRDGSGEIYVYVGGRRLKGDVVVLAAGPWNRLLASDIGVRLPLVTYGARALLLLGPRRLTRISLSDNVYSFYSRPTDKPLLNSLGLFLAGNGNVPGVAPGAPKRIDAKYVSGIVRGIARRVGRRPLRMWSGWGVLEMSLDHFPLVGLAEPQSTLYVIGGLNGYGATVGPALAEILADAVLRGEEKIGSPCHDASRFWNDLEERVIDVDWEPFLLYPGPPSTANKKCLYGWKEGSALT